MTTIFKSIFRHFHSVKDLKPRKATTKSNPSLLWNSDNLKLFSATSRVQVLLIFITYSQTILLSIQDLKKKTRNNSSTESINHSLRLTHAHIFSIGFKSGLYTGSHRILCPCCSSNSWISTLYMKCCIIHNDDTILGNADIR